MKAWWNNLRLWTATAGCQCHHPVNHYLSERAHSDLRRRFLLGGSALLLSAFAGFTPSRSLAAARLMAGIAKRPIVFTNARVFDGSGQAPYQGVQVLVTGNKIVAILSAGESIPEDAFEIDCQGKLLMRSEERRVGKEGGSGRGREE